MPTFLFADLAGFTALTEAHGDADASELARRFEALVHARLPDGARLVKMMGDAAMVVADDAPACVRFARDLLSAVEGLPGRPAVRIGINVGDAVQRDGDFFGHAVNVAARLAARAEPCQVLVTGAVKAAVDASGPASGMAFEPLGAQRLRNVSEALAIFALTADCGDFPTDPVCRMRLSDYEGVGMVHYEGRTYHFCSLDCTRAFAERPSGYAREARAHGEA